LEFPVGKRIAGNWELETGNWKQFKEAVLWAML
jgi:hypothetical protein